MTLPQFSAPEDRLGPVSNNEPRPLNDFAAMDSESLADVCRAWIRCDPDVVLLLDAEQRVIHVSHAAASHPESQFWAQLSGVFWPALWSNAVRIQAESALIQARTGQTARFQGELETALDRGQWWDAIVTGLGPIDGARGAEVLVLLRDATAIRAAEAQIARTKRLEATRRIEDGIAHDFSNLLSVIMSATESLAADTHEETSRSLAMVGLEAAGRGAALVRRLRALTGPQTSHLETVEAIGAIRWVARLLPSTLAENILLEASVPEAPFCCRGDRIELESALLNICLNARDAMPLGGRLRLIVRQELLEAGAARGLGLQPGRYAAFVVEDSGIGMSTRTLKRAAEPFFTTKADAGGTGLGLNNAQSFARHNGGRLILESTEGAGSTISIYLPVVDAAAQGELDLPEMSRGAACAQDDSVDPEGFHLAVLAARPAFQHRTEDSRRG